MNPGVWHRGHEKTLLHFQSASRPAVEPGPSAAGAGQSLTSDMALPRRNSRRPPVGRRRRRHRHSGDWRPGRRGLVEPPRRTPSLGLGAVYVRPAGPGDRPHPRSSPHLGHYPGGSTAGRSGGSSWGGGPARSNGTLSEPRRHRTAACAVRCARPFDAGPCLRRWWWEGCSQGWDGGCSDAASRNGARIGPTNGAPGPARAQPMAMHPFRR
jgi:hypothetical protein